MWCCLGIHSKVTITITRPENSILTEMQAIICYKPMHIYTIKCTYNNLFNFHLINQLLHIKWYHKWMTKYVTIEVIFIVKMNTRSFNVAVKSTKQPCLFCNVDSCKTNVEKTLLNFYTGDIISGFLFVIIFLSTHKCLEFIGYVI